MPGRLSEQIQILNKGIQQRENIIEGQEEKIRDMHQMIANQDAEIKVLREKIVTACESIDNVIRLLDDYRDIMLNCMESMEKIRNKINKGE